MADPVTAADMGARPKAGSAEYQRAWRLKSLEERRARDRERYVTNRERIRKVQRNYYLKNQEALKERWRIYNRENRELILQKHRDDPRGRMLAAARHRAKAHGIEFSITKADIIVPESCPVLGIPLIAARGAHTFNSPSLDRLDNSRGYVKGNVHVISRRANALKNDATLEEIEAVARYMRKGQINGD